MRPALHSPRFWFGIVLSVAALAWAVRGVAWADLLAELSTADYGWLIPTAILVLLGQLARAARWRILFGDGPRPSLRDAFAILSIGYLVSAVFPLRLGDPVRAWLADTHTPARGSEAFGTVMVERAIDLLTVLALLAAIVPGPAARLLQDQLGPGPWSNPARLAWIAIAAVAAVYVALFAASRAGARVGRAVSALLEGVGASPRFARGIGASVAGFAAGVGVLGRPRAAAAASAWSLVVWVLGGIEYWVCLKAFHLDLSFAAAVFVLCGTAVFAILPSSPGYVGLFHTAVIVTLGIFADVPKDAALSYAIVLHGVIMVVLIALGLVGLRMMALAPRDLEARLGGAAVDA